MKQCVRLLVFAIGLAISGASSAQTLGIATSNPGSLFHNIGSAIASAANQADIPTTIQSATSPNQYIPFVASGGIEFGIANLQEINYATEGKAWFSGNAYPDLRIVAVLMPLREAIFVRADSEIRSIADLEGKPMVDGFTAQSTILPQLDAMYASAGLSRSEMIPVPVSNIVDGADAFIAGKSAGFIFAHGAGKVREADAAVGGLRALPIDNTQENLERMRQFWPAAILTEIKPGRNTPGVMESGYFMAYPQVIFTHANASDDAVYSMTKMLFESQNVLSEIFPLFNLFVPDNMASETAPSRFHDGAIRFFKEADIWDK